MGGCEEHIIWFCGSHALRDRRVTGLISSERVFFRLPPS
jgi:hypothetical protein